MGNKPIGDLNRELYEISLTLDYKYSEESEKRDSYDIAKAEYENSKARFTIEIKLKNIGATQTDISANAICMSHEDRMKMIRAYSEYNKVKNEIKALESKKDSLIEMCQNIRKEMSMLHLK